MLTCDIGSSSGFEQENFGSEIGVLPYYRLLKRSGKTCSLAPFLGVIPVPAVRKVLARTRRAALRRASVGTGRHKGHHHPSEGEAGVVVLSEDEEGLHLPRDHAQGGEIGPDPDHLRDRPGGKTEAAIKTKIKTEAKGKAKRKERRKEE
mmetsp:Transcript_86201/g.152611  ORF Transcript_86201/g.152611 Transcript_86201/m.152611 type:complete len:149 (-) Transcript_86201:1726-2172(-)